MENVEKVALPPGWAWAKLGDICDIVGGITVDAKRRGPDLVELPYLRVANVQRGRLDLSVIKQIAVPQAQAERLRLCPGDVLLNEGGDRDKVGRGWVWEGQIENCIFQNHVFRARPRHASIQPRWLSHYLNEAARPYFLSGSKQTTNLASLSLTKVAATPVAVPPANEQLRLIEVIADLLGEVDDVAAAMARACGQMADYRASLLHAACTGALTADWRAENPHTAEDGAALLRRILAERRAAWEGVEYDRLVATDKVPRGEGWKARYSAPLSIASDDLPPIPTAWTWASLDQLAFEKGYGTSTKCDVTGNGPAVLRIPNVQAGEINFSSLKMARSELGFAAREYLSVGDLLIVRTNGSSALIGRAALVERAPVSATYFASYLIRFRLIGMPTLQKWVSRMFASGLIRSQVIQFAATSAGQYNVSQSNLARFAIPLPPIAEIEAALELLSEGQLNLSEMPEAGEVADLRQSILHAAFSGRLVPQDPTDEPAALLLARLRADAAPSAPRRRRAPAKAPRP